VAVSCDNGNETTWSRKGRNFSAGQELCIVVMVMCARFFQNSSVQTIVVYLHILLDENGSCPDDRGMSPYSAGREWFLSRRSWYISIFCWTRLAPVQTIVVYLHILLDETGCFQIPNWSSCFTVVLMHVAVETVSLRKLLSVVPNGGRSKFFSSGSRDQKSARARACVCARARACVAGHVDLIIDSSVEM
jgi:hypothetical protein